MNPVQNVCSVDMTYLKHEFLMWHSKTAVLSKLLYLSLLDFVMLEYSHGQTINPLQGKCLFIQT